MKKIDIRRKNLKTTKYPIKVYNAIIIDENGERHYYKSARSRIFFERRCDLTNSLNQCIGGDWQFDYPGQIIIEERIII